MDFNGVKSNVMYISKKKTPSATNRNYVIYALDGRQLECVPSITDQGITVHALDKVHGSHCSEGNKTLGLLKRIGREIRDSNIRKLLYCALVRPKFEYGSNPWTPYTTKHPALLGNILRRAVNYPQNMAFKERLVGLN